MAAHVDLLVEAQHAEIDRQPEMLRSHRETGLIDHGGISPFRVWWGNGIHAVDQYSEAINLMERALHDGAGVCAIEWTRGRVWTQEVWVMGAAS